MTGPDTPPEVAEDARLASVLLECRREAPAVFARAGATGGAEEVRALLREDR